MATVQHIIDHPLWPVILGTGTIRVGRYTAQPKNGAPRPRFDVKAPDLQTAAAWEQVEVLCCHCRTPIHPLRRRAKGDTRPPSQVLYLAVSCETQLSPKCSKGNAARDEYTRIKADLLSRGKL